MSVLTVPGRHGQHLVTFSNSCGPVDRSSARLRVFGHPGEVDHDARLVTDSPSVVPCWYGDDITCADLNLGAVIHDDLWRPETTYPTCAAWQLLVPTIGLTWSDHFQPGWKVALA